MGNRIRLDMTFKDAIIVMCDGNPGALTVLMELFKHKGDDAIVLLCHLDDMGIYGSKIWMAYKDVCYEKLEDLIALIPKREALKAALASVR